MGDNNLGFQIGDRIRIEEEEYIVQGAITFYNDADDYKWIEYKIKSVNNSNIRWLSIDSTYSEYAIYNQCKSSKDFKEDKLIDKGYKEADYGNGRVISFIGDVDVSTGDKVSFREFEDSTEERIMAIETWEDEVEYSQGYYLDESEIKKVSSTNDINYGNDNSNFISGNDQGSRSNKSKGVVIAIVVLIIGILFFAIVINTGSGSGKEAMSKVISTNSNFTYSTSITSDLDDTQKADVYTTSLSIEQATKTIIDGIGGEATNVQENAEDGSVAIMTDEEYCLVYKSENEDTLVQISTRRYVYSSTNKPYRCHHSTGIYYRRYYYSRGYSTDKNKYGKYRNGYENYSGGTVDVNSNNKYQDYSNSVRQSSTSSRTSSGGGTSSGK